MLKVPCYMYDSKTELKNVNILAASSNKANDISNIGC